MPVPLFNLAPNLTNSLPQSFGLLDEAFNGGINFFDSLRYPVPQRAETQGRSEEYLGRWIKLRKIPRDRIVLATKVAGPSGQMTWIRGGPKCLDCRNITNAIDSSYVPMFGETEYDPTRQFCSVGIEEQLDALSRAVAAGKVNDTMLSLNIHSLANMTPINNCALSEIVSVQVYIDSSLNSYNLLCRTFDAGIAECCHHEGLFCHVGEGGGSSYQYTTTLACYKVSLECKPASPLPDQFIGIQSLAMGILSGKYFAADGVHFPGRYSEGESRYNLSNNIIKAAALEYHDIAIKYSLHPVLLAIAFVLRHPLVASAIFGATKSWQLQEVLKACMIELTPEIIAEINNIHARFPDPCPE
uniref:NADP-dependent oxidoreductase domain-containing protein n=1 Tax=Salix viminalis TaxID=40686 RepID=A0A6N2L7S6_SALVM